MAALPMALAVYYACRLTDWSLSGHKGIKALVLTGAIAAGVAIYGVVARLLRSEDALEAIAVFRNKFGR
jgi:putative peptidoglycan lipid II flippase